MAKIIVRMKIAGTKIENWIDVGPGTSIEDAIKKIAGSSTHGFEGLEIGDVVEIKDNQSHTRSKDDKITESIALELTLTKAKIEELNQ